MSKSIVQVYQARIRANIKADPDQREPPVIVREGSKRQYGNTVQIEGPCRIVYSPDKPLSCGARLWIETTSAVQVID